MANELTINNSELAVLADKGSIDNVLKPLTKEIFLFDTYVAGTSHLTDKSVLDEIRPNDKLTLKRENNKFDDMAILLIAASGKKLGYIPEKDNTVFSRLMDAGKLLTAGIKTIEKVTENYYKIKIDIFLVDF